MKVLIADALEKAGIGGLKACGCEVIERPGLKDAALLAALKETQCDVLVVRSTKVTGEMLRGAPALKLVVRAGSGIDTIDVDAATEVGVRVCNCPGMNAVAVAELTIGLMIALDRQIVDETDDLRHGIWKKKEYSKARGLKGRTLGIVGMGRIGFEVAKRAAAFEMRLIYSDVVPNERAEREFGVRKVSFDELLETSDFVTLHVPGGADTRHMIGRMQLARMKPTAYVINCARGGIVDEEALADAIESGKLAGAAMDVYEIEPAASERAFKDPIPKVPHVYGTHHVGASTEQAQSAVAEEVVRIVRAYKDSGELLHCANPPEAAVA
ncbi:MAG: hypothetical protein BroJett003_25790 [Planctomycetota bacterium]|nr:MAG: hypothetical protein BroJett003_25790 [Planctomycetota bacterium]